MLRVRNILAVGWPASTLLLICNVVAEWFCIRAVGGDAGGFLFVTVHFVLMPVLSLSLLVFTTIRAVRTAGMLKKAAAFSSVIVPCLILWIAITGDLGFARLFLPFRT